MFIAYLNEEKYKDIWNKFILAEGGEYFQSWQWGQFEKENGNEVFYLGAFNKNDSGKDIFCAACALYLKPLSFGKSALTVYRGPVMDFLSAEIYPAIELLFSEIEKIAKERKSIFFRIDPPLLNSQASYLGAYFSTLEKKIKGSVRRLTDSNKYVLNILQEESEILSNAPTKFSYNLKIAESRFEITESAFPKDARFLKVFKNKTADYWERLFQYLNKDFGEDGKLSDMYLKTFFAREKEEIVAGIIAAYFGSSAAVLYEANKLKDDHMPLYLLHWRAIKDARAQGFSIYEASKEKSAVAGDLGGRLEFLSDSYDIVYNKFWHRILKNFKFYLSLRLGLSQTRQRLRQALRAEAEIFKKYPL